MAEDKLEEIAQQQELNQDLLDQAQDEFWEDAKVVEQEIPGITEAQFEPSYDAIEENYNRLSAQINMVFENQVAQADMLYQQDLLNPEVSLTADQMYNDRIEGAYLWRDYMLGELEEARQEEYDIVERGKQTYTEANLNYLDTQVDEFNAEIKKEGENVDEFYQDYVGNVIKLIKSTPIPPPEIWDVEPEIRPKEWDKLEGIPVEQRTWAQYFCQPETTDIPKFLKTHPWVLTGGRPPAESAVADLENLYPTPPLEIWTPPEGEEEPSHWKYFKDVPIEERDWNQYCNLPPEVDVWTWLRNNSYILEGREPTVEEVISGLPPVPYLSIQEETGKTTWPEIFNQPPDTDIKAFLTENPEALSHIYVGAKAVNEYAESIKKMGYKEAFMRGGGPYGMLRLAGAKVGVGMAETAPMNLGYLANTLERYVFNPGAYAMVKYIAPTILPYTPITLSETGKAVEPWGLPTGEEYGEFLEAWEDELWYVKLLTEVLEPWWWIGGAELAKLGTTLGRIPQAGRVIEPAFKGAGSFVTATTETPIKLVTENIGKLGYKGAKGVIDKLDRASFASIGIDLETLAKIPAEELKNMKPADLLKYKQISLGEPEVVLTAVKGPIGRAYKTIANAFPESWRAPLRKLNPTVFYEVPTDELFRLDQKRWAQAVADNAVLYHNRVEDSLESILNVLLRTPDSVGASEAKAALHWKTDLKKLFGSDEKGFCPHIERQKGWEDASLAINDIFEHPERYILNEQQSEYIRACHNLLDLFVDLALRSGVDIHMIDFGIAGHYMPRKVEAMMTGTTKRTDVAPGVGRSWEKHRVAETQAELINVGVVYAMPDEALKDTCRSIARAIADKKMVGYVAKHGNTAEKKVALMFREEHDAMMQANRQNIQFKNVTGHLEDAYGGKVLSPQTLAAISRFDPDLGYELKNIMTARAETILHTDITGFASPEDVVRLAREKGYVTTGPSAKELNEMYVKAGAENMSNVDASILRDALGLKMDYLGENIANMAQDIMLLEARINANPAKHLTELIPRAEMAEGELKYITKGQYRKVFGREPRPSSLTPDGKRVRWEYVLDELAEDLRYGERAVYEAASAEDLLRIDIQQAYKDKSELTALRSSKKSAEQEIELCKGLSEKVTGWATGYTPLVSAEGKLKVKYKGVQAEEQTTKFSPEELKALFKGEPEPALESAINKMTSGKVLQTKEVNKIANYFGFEVKPAPENMKGYKVMFEGKKGTPVEGATFYAKNNAEAAMYLNEVASRVKFAEELPALKSIRDKEAVAGMIDKVKGDYKKFQGEYTKTKRKYQRAKELTRQPSLDEARVTYPAFGNAVFDKDLARALDAKLLDKGIPALKGLQSLNQAMRMFKASMDLSAPLIQLNAIMFRNPALWAKAEGMQFRTAMNPGFYDRYIVKNMDEALRMASHGGYVGSFEYTEAFAGVMNALKGKKIIGKPGTTFMEQTYGRFDAAFGICGDYARLEMWKSMAPMMEREMGEEGLTRLARELNLMTGVTSSKGLGIGVTQQQIESAFIFFAPRYTRAGFELISDLFKGGWESKEAIKSLGSFLAGGEMAYQGAVAALGQEANLDPTKGNFKCIEVAGQYLGIGGFYNAAVRLAAGIYTTFDEGDYVDLFSPVKTRNKDGKVVLNRWDNPTLNFFFNRTAPLSSTAYLMGLEQNEFFGEPLESLPDYIKMGAQTFVPIWIEQTFLEKRRPEGAPATIVSALGELAGAKVYSLSPYEKEQRLREEYSQRDFGKAYNETTGSERKQLYNAHEDLEELKEKARVESSYFDDSLNYLWDEWNATQDAALEDTIHRLEAAEKRYIEGMRAGVRNTWQVGTAYKNEVREAMRGKAAAREALENNPRYAPILEWFEQPPDKDKVPTVTLAVREYEDMMYGSEELERLFIDNPSMAYDYQDELEENFRAKWGDDMYKMVKQEMEATFLLIDYPPLYREYHKAKNILKPYWKIPDKYEDMIDGASLEMSKAIKASIEQEQVEWRVNHPEGDYYLQLFYGKKPLIRSPQTAALLDKEIKAKMMIRAAEQEVRFEDLIGSLV